VIQIDNIKEKMHESSSTNIFNSIRENRIVRACKKNDGFLPDFTITSLFYCLESHLGAQINLII
jgi:hypothetical protein